jgi:hypothetical protein
MLKGVISILQLPYLGNGAVDFAPLRRELPRLFASLRWIVAG